MERIDRSEGYPYMTYPIKTTGYASVCQQCLKHIEEIEQLKQQVSGYLTKKFLIEENKNQSEAIRQLREDKVRLLEVFNEFWANPTVDNLLKGRQLIIEMEAKNV